MQTGRKREAGKREENIVVSSKEKKGI